MESKFVTYPDGGIHWLQNNLLHRIDGPAVIEANGTQKWYQNGCRHREDGPAAIYSNGTKTWSLYGQLHRIDGPAIEDVEMNRIAWWINGRQYDFINWLELTPLDDEQKVLLKLQYG